MYIFNTVYVLYGIILKKCMRCNLNFQTKLACLSINISGYLSNSVGITSYMVSVTIWLRFFYFMVSHWIQLF